MKSLWLALLGVVFAQQSAYAELQFPEDKFAALAFSRSTGRMGKAVAESSTWMARDTAIRACYHGDCEVKMEVRRGCIGVAWGTETPGPGHVQPYPGMEWYGWGAVPFSYVGEIKTEADLQLAKQKTRDQSGAMAVTACENVTKNRCQVIDTFCTWDHSISPEAEIRLWINELGGENAAGITTLRRYLQRSAHSYLMSFLKLSSSQAACVIGNYYSSLYRIASACRIGVNQLDQMYGIVVH